MPSHVFRPISCKVDTKGGHRREVKAPSALSQPGSPLSPPAHTPTRGRPDCSCGYARQPAASAAPGSCGSSSRARKPGSRSGTSPTPLSTPPAARPAGFVSWPHRASTPGGPNPDAGSAKPHYPPRPFPQSRRIGTRLSSCRSDSSDRADRSPAPRAAPRPPPRRHWTAPRRRGIKDWQSCLRRRCASRARGLTPIKTPGPSSMVRLVPSA